MELCREVANKIIIRYIFSELHFSTIIIVVSAKYTLDITFYNKGS